MIPRADTVTHWHAVCVSDSDLSDGRGSAGPGPITMIADSDFVAPSLPRPPR